MKCLYARIWLVLFLTVSADLWAAVKIVSWKTDKGAKVNFVRASEIPMVDIRLVFSAGSVRDGSNGGLAKVVNRLLLGKSTPLSSNLPIHHSPNYLR